MGPRRLLALDGAGNVLLGLPLLVAPGRVSGFLGLPAGGGDLYPVILGSVFVGIGAALLLEWSRPSAGGLGIAGALVINLVFGVALVAWLLFAGGGVPIRGRILLTGLAFVLFGFVGLEARALAREPQP
jgi:hypothetical protein